MSNRKKVHSLLLLTILMSLALIVWPRPEKPFSSCPKIGDDKECLFTGRTYSFILAGHLYGASHLNKDSYVPAQTLLSHIDAINSMKPDIFIALGDVVRKPEEKSAVTFKEVFENKIHMPFFDAPGNHEHWMGDELFNRYFNPNYFAFVYGQTSFIFLDSGRWDSKIQPAQLAFFKEALVNAESDKLIRNIVILSHKLIWVRGRKPYLDVFVNNNQQVKDDGNNFLEDVHPLLVATKKPIVWASGDLHEKQSFSLFYHHDEDDHVTYIATGLGDRDEDVIVLATVSPSGDMNFEPVSLSGKMMDPIEHYGVSYWKKLQGLP